MERDALVEEPNEVPEWEYAGVVPYTQFSFIVRIERREVYHRFFRKSGEEALGPAYLVGDEIVSLGGVTTVERGVNQWGTASKSVP